MTARDRECAEFRDKLREFVKPGDTLYTVLRHVSRSGMQRSIGVIVKSETGDLHDWSGWIAKAIGQPWDDKRSGVKMGGCGTDIGFEVVYSLAYALFPDGFGCTGEDCPSNDHSNGDRDYTRSVQVLSDEVIARDQMKRSAVTDTHWHKSGGYALHQRWI